MADNRIGVVRIDLPDFLPPDYARQLEGFCREHDIVLTMDEVQAGFCRTGRMFCFEHYGIAPDLIACRKGISSSLPLSAVLGKSKIMDLYGPAEMTSTHTGSPVPAAVPWTQRNRGAIRRASARPWPVSPGRPNSTSAELSIARHRSSCSGDRRNALTPL